jgi:nucleotidyltransferase substrate binding protein (TIGR01987 family)
MEDIRWQQRLENYCKAYDKLFEAALKIGGSNKNLLEEGLIQRFEFTFVLAWNLMKDYCEYLNGIFLKGSRDANNEAYKLQIIDDAHIWLEMLNSRLLTSHTYNENTITEIIDKTIHNYIFPFEMLKDKMLASK